MRLCPNEEGEEVALFSQSFVSFGAKIAELIEIELPYMMSIQSNTHVTAREEDENVQKIEINLAHFSDTIQKYNGYDVAVVF